MAANCSPRAQGVVQGPHQSFLLAVPLGHSVVRRESLRIVTVCIELRNIHRTHALSLQLYVSSYACTTV